MIITCSQCQTRFRVDDSLIKETGTRVRCSNCQSVFTVFHPRAGSGAQERPSDAIPRPPASQAPPPPADEEPIPRAPVPRAPEPRQMTFAARPLPPAERDFYIPDEQDEDDRPSPEDEDAAPGRADAYGGREEGAGPGGPSGRGTAHGAGQGASPRPQHALSEDAAAEPAGQDFRGGPRPARLDPRGQLPASQGDPGPDPGLGGDPLDPDQSQDPLGADPLGSGSPEREPAEMAAYRDPGGAGNAGGGLGDPDPDYDDLEISPRASEVFADAPPPRPAPRPAKSGLLQPRNRRPRDRKALALAAAVAAALLTAGLYFYISFNSAPEPGVAVQSVAPYDAGAPGTPPAASAAGGGLSGSSTPGAGPQVDNASLTQPDLPNSTEHLNFTRDMTHHHYRSNSDAGNILIVTGRVENHFPDRRSYIKVKAVLKDSKGTVVAERDAYAGNYLTEPELTTLPMSEILARLALRGGQNSSNINVTSGSSVPFMLVFDKLPSDLAEYVVECVSSTPAGDVAETSRTGAEAVS